MGQVILYQMPPLPLSLKHPIIYHQMNLVNNFDQGRLYNYVELLSLAGCPGCFCAYLPLFLCCCIHAATESLLSWSLGVMHGLWAELYPLQNSHVKALIANVMVFGDGAFGK